jgi:uncharacterized protein
MSSNLVFSDNPCAAFLAAIIHSFEENHPRGYLGRTAMQKLTYFSQALGVPIPCSFGIYTYGPYSDTVTFTMESLMADDVVEDRSSKPEYSNYRLGSNAHELLGRFEREVIPYTGVINRVVDALGGFKPQELELIATIHFIAGRQQQIHRRGPNKQEVIREFKGVKREKFEDDDISNWYDALNKAGLICTSAYARG